MSRPKPTILQNYTDPRTFKDEQVLQASAIYAVFYDDTPINLRTVDLIRPARDGRDAGPKYKKSSFANPGHAFNLASKLNQTFRTDKFNVVRLTHGEAIVEAPTD